MLISTRGRYALRVLIDIAEHQTDGCLPLKEVAERQEISEKYLKAILKSLVKEGVLIGVRGKGGGYRLSRAPDQFSVREILCQRQSENVGFRRKGMSFFAGQYTSVYSLNHHITCRFEARQALIYQLVLGLTGENDTYNYS